MIVETKLPSKEFWLSDCDPSTIEPPTVDTLTRMAVEEFGEGARVDEGGDCLTVVVQRGNQLRVVCSWFDDEDARECARYLAGRRK